MYLHSAAASYIINFTVIAQCTEEANAEGAPTMIVELDTIVPTGGYLPYMLDSTLGPDENVFGPDRDPIHRLLLCRFRLEKSAYVDDRVCG